MSKRHVIGKIFSYIENMFIKRTKLAIEIDEFEPFLINEGQLIKNRKIVFNTFNGKAVLFAVKFEDFNFFCKYIKKMYIPGKLPLKKDFVTYSIAVKNVGNTIINETSISLTSSSELILYESSPNMKCINLEDIPTDRFEYYIEFTGLSPNESSRIVFSTDRPGIRNVHYTINGACNDNVTKWNHYYVRPINDDTEIVIIDNKKIKLPKIIKKGNNVYLLNPEVKNWKEI